MSVRNQNHIIDGRQAVGLVLFEPIVEQKLDLISNSAVRLYLFLIKRIINQEKRYNKRMINLSEIRNKLNISDKQIYRLRKELREIELIFFDTYSSKKYQSKIGIYSLCLPKELYNKIGFLESPLSIKEQEEHMKEDKDDSIIPF